MSDQALIRSILHYDPTTGVFRWKVGLSLGTTIGGIAGTNSGNGIRQIRINKRAYAAATLAWLYMTGIWPAMIVDHKDGNPLNNKWKNLRLATRSQNQMNKRAVRKSRGLRGTQYRPDMDKWTAKIAAGGRTIYLGSFATTEEAHLAYRRAASKLHGEFAYQGEFAR